MKRFNYEEYLDNISRNYKKSIIVLILFIVLYVGVFLLGFFISNYENKDLIMIIFSIILGVLILCISVTLIGFTLRYRKDIKQIYYILGGYLTTITGVIVDNKGIVTSISGRKGIELTVKSDEDEVTVYLDLIFKDTLFNIGDQVTFKTSESFIIQYEVHHE